MSEERLQKILARAGIASRRKVEELIREARVTVNGRVAEIGDKADLQRDAVKVDGKRIQPHAGQHRYLLLNKPRGVMSTVADPGGRPTVMELVPAGWRKALVPVGRLDFLTEGLLLLTDDGELAQQVAHPRYGCVKTYEVKVKGQPEEAEVDRLRAGIVLDGKRTSPCRITMRPAPRRNALSENSWWMVELSEGRTRQIREMFQRIGHPVQKLRRVAIGPVSDPHLPVGSLRELTEREVEQLRGVGKKKEEKNKNKNNKKKKKSLGKERERKKVSGMAAGQRRGSARKSS
ncbi:MAG TPA: pseudouridine synthase [Thermoanaerobaculia bacterium]|nr:pseudouridine synthase [Thermoanaerobaculia bacterium]